MSQTDSRADDPHIGELNRTQLLAAVAQSIGESVRFRSSFAFLLISIDDLAGINDSFGFDVADEVIDEIARRIRARLRGGDVSVAFQATASAFCSRTARARTCALPPSASLRRCATKSWRRGLAPSP